MFITDFIVCLLVTYCNTSPNYTQIVIHIHSQIGDSPNTVLIFQTLILYPFQPVSTEDSVNPTPHLSFWRNCPFRAGHPWNEFSGDQPISRTAQPGLPTSRLGYPHGCGAAAVCSTAELRGDRGGVPPLCGAKRCRCWPSMPSVGR